MTHAVESFLFMSVKQHVKISGCDDTEIRDIQEVHCGRGLSLLDRDDARHGSVTIRSWKSRELLYIYTPQHVHRDK